MARSPVLHALERKYARLLGCQKRLRHPAPSLAEDLAHIEAVMRLFDPEWRPEKVRPVVPSMPSKWAKKGAGIRTAFEVVKEAETPLTTLQITRAVYQRLGIPLPDKHEFKVVRSSFHTNLLHQASKGLLIYEGKPKRWEIGRLNQG